MGKEKLLQQIIQGKANVRFQYLCLLVKSYGFHLDRLSGSHQIFINPDVPELINIQNVKGKPKPYHFKQFLSIYERLSY